MPRAFYTRRPPLFVECVLVTPLYDHELDRMTAEIGRKGYIGGNGIEREIEKDNVRTT